ncbi:hypothetical protein [Pseudalkalibacillus decolorationis]|uniref:hypothetical protein n=1 Tax=Pseudalkalibacillus decolorationis TaxID=163879 RepID=UPI00214936E2|nr:hypothetical protein [Pseudalkalibacillus decolorationis]
MFNSGMRGFGGGLIIAAGILAFVHYQGTEQVDSEATAVNAAETVTYEQVESYLQSKDLVAVQQKQWEQFQSNQKTAEKKPAEDKKEDAPEKPEEPKEEVIKTTVVISKGTSTGQVCDYLESKKIINSSDALIKYLRSNNLESQVRFGSYEVNSKMTIAEIASVITSA